MHVRRRAAQAAEPRCAERAAHRVGLREPGELPRIGRIAVATGRVERAPEQPGHVLETTQVNRGNAIAGLLHAQRVELVVAERRPAVAGLALALAIEDAEATPGARVDGRGITGHETIERRIAADQLAQVRGQGLAEVGVDAVDGGPVGGRHQLPGAVGVRHRRLRLTCRRETRRIGGRRVECGVERHGEERVVVGAVLVPQQVGHREPAGGHCLPILCHGQRQRPLRVEAPAPVGPRVERRVHHCQRVARAVVGPERNVVGHSAVVRTRDRAMARRAGHLAALTHRAQPAVATVSSHGERAAVRRVEVQPLAERRRASIVSEGVG